MQNPSESAPVSEQTPVDPAPVSQPPVSEAAPAVAAENPVSENAATEKPADVASADGVKAWENASSFQGAGFMSTVINTINTVIGAAIISIAYSIKISGVWGAIVLIIAVLIPSLITSYYMSVCTEYTGEIIYGKIGEKLYNKAVGIIANIFLMILDFGIDVAYMNVLFNQISALGRDVFNVGDFFEKNITVISLIVSILVLFPLCSIKNMDTLKFTSGIAVISVFIFVITCVGLGIKGFATRGWDLSGWPKDLSALSTSFAVFVLCFCSHINTPTITAEIRYKSGKSKYGTKVKKAFRATCYAYVVCAISYLLVGILGYAGFGDEIKDSILNNLVGGVWWYIRIAYGLVVMFSYPILGFPGCLTIDSFFFKGERTVTRRYVEGFIWTMLTWIVCVAIPSFSKILSLTGNTCGVFLTFIWPSLYFIACYRKEMAKPADMKSTWFKPKPYENVIAWIIFVLGIIVGIWAVTMEVKNFSG